MPGPTPRTGLGVPIHAATEIGAQRAEIGLGPGVEFKDTARLGEIVRVVAITERECIGGRTRSVEDGARGENTRHVEIGVHTGPRNIETPARRAEQEVAPRAGAWIETVCQGPSARRRAGLQTVGIFIGTTKCV